MGLIPWSGRFRWRREWQPTPVFLPGKSKGQRSLAGYSPQSHKELGMTEHTDMLFRLHAAWWAEVLKQPAVKAGGMDSSHRCFWWFFFFQI